ncbi:hypothetical protein ACGF8B_10965 [Streptomyces sp. NPDC047917]|uniref:hypothetical protein n=1 Tax=Streptomyces sp. NPDC047917 TaxID=3365491 RepID=UPI0037125F68
MLCRSRTALVFLVMAFALTACGRFTVMPPPDGEPVVLEATELATTWTDAEGGTLTLKRDERLLGHLRINDGDFVSRPLAAPYMWPFLWRPPT